MTKKLMLGMIGLYQSLRAGRPSPCRFTPSCSEYAREAIDLHGAVRGGWLAARRLGRCQPLASPGYDPVPVDHPTDTRSGAASQC